MKRKFFSDCMFYISNVSLEIRKKRKQRGNVRDLYTVKTILEAVQFPTFLRSKNLQVSIHPLQTTKLLRGAISLDVVYLKLINNYSFVKLIKGKQLIFVTFLNGIVKVTITEIYWDQLSHRCSIRTPKEQESVEAYLVWYMCLKNSYDCK